MAKSKSLGASAQKKLTIGFYGPEPEVGADLSSESAFGLALNWYNTFYDPEIAERWVDEYLTIKKYTPKDIAAIRRSGHLTQSRIHCMRMLTLDCVLPDRMQARIDDQVREALKIGRLKTEVMFAGRLGPAERNKRKAMEFRGDLDRIYDLIWEGKIKPTQIQYFETLKKIGMKPAQATVLVPVYKELLAEELDAEINHSKKNQKARQTYLKDLVEALEAWSKGKEEKPEVKTKKKVTERKIGKRIFKSTRPVATAAGLKFKAIDEDTKIASINPKAILGAQILVIFNAKYKQLAIIRAANAEGLSVKGTTILNVDEKTSEAKRAGRHVAAIKEMQTAPKTKIIKLFKDINADLIPFRTRTSEDIILVRAIK